MAAKRMHSCGRCPRGIIVRDMPAGLGERLLKLVTGRRPYRCLDCGRRFYDRPMRRSAAPLRGDAATFSRRPLRPLVASHAR